MSSGRRSSRSSSRRSASSAAPVSASDDQIAELLSKLQALLPEARARSADRGSTARVLQETCSYIRSLHQEVDDLSERLTELLAAADVTSDQAAAIRSLLL